MQVELEATHYAVYPSRHHLAAKIRAFVDILAEHLGSEGQAAEER